MIDDELDLACAAYGFKYISATDVIAWDIFLETHL